MGHNVKLSQLRAFQAIMLTGSVTAASERLHATQPAISRHLAALEQATGIRMFERTRGGRMVPTALGLRFYRHIEGTLAGIESIPDIAKLLASTGQARLRIGATPPLLNSAFFTAALDDFVGKQPGTKLTIESRSRHDIEEWIAHGQIDVGLALLPADNPLIRAVPLLSTSAVAVVRSDHPLARRRVLDPGLVRNSRLILPSRQLLRALIDQSIGSDGQSLECAIEASSAVTCCKLAADGLGVAVCDPFSASAFASAGLRVLRWKPDVPLTYGMLVAQGRELSQPAGIFAECLERRAQKSPL
ncbi:LysR family transcriptional regulator [Acidovorax sp. SDU_ACID1]|jgi:DNA-binding transcriptional LysR family regulator|uniref:LysR family transcriptional regulator n=1 Tax=Acidovorax sp. SDU_ACID1 TaxID=3136632 RepID=UPI003872AA5B